MQAITLGTIITDLTHKDDFTEKINTLSTTRKALKADEVVVWTPRLIGTETTVHGGQLRESDLTLFAQLTIGAPILIGHQKETKPIGRVYDAWVEQKMVYAPFYVPLARSDTQDLIIDINTGIIAEVSASFAFDKPTCSICSQDMRSLQCGHVPFKDNAFFYYETPQKVLEISLVYRGGYPGTGFANLMNDPEWTDKFTALSKGDKTLQKQMIENLMVPGLVSLLNRLVEDRCKNGEYSTMTRIKCITQMASYADMAVSDVEGLLTKEVKICPTLDQFMSSNPHHSGSHEGRLRV